MMFETEGKVLVQGITGHQGSVHADLMMKFGTKVVGGVTPGRAGSRVHGLPVFDDVSTAMKVTGADSSVVFVPARNCLDAALEGIDAGIRLMTIVTEHVPVHDAMRIKRRAEMADAVVIGPNSPGLAIPSRTKLGIMPNDIFMEGGLAVISRSGTLTYEVVRSLSDHKIGQCFVAGIGGDQVIGTSMSELAEMVIDRFGPKGFVLIGEIGGGEEIRAARRIAARGLPVVAYVAGKTAPPGKRMGHAGAIIGNKSETYADKVLALKNEGAEVCDRLSSVPTSVRSVFYPL